MPLSTALKIPWRLCGFRLKELLSAFQMTILKISISYLPTSEMRCSRNLEYVNRFYPNKGIVRDAEMVCFLFSFLASVPLMLLVRLTSSSFVRKPILTARKILLPVSFLYALQFGYQYHYRFWRNSLLPTVLPSAVFAFLPVCGNSYPPCQTIVQCKNPVAPNHEG